MLPLTSWLDDDFDHPRSHKRKRRAFDPAQVHAFDLGQPVQGNAAPNAELDFSISNMTKPVVGHWGGLNHAALTVHPEGVLCVLQPYLTMSENDRIEVFCVDPLTPVAWHIVRDDQINKRISLYILSTHFPDGTVEPVFCRVTRDSGNSSETDRFKLKVDREAPAGLDPIPSTAEHDNLKIPGFEPDIIAFGVDEAAAAKGVPVTIDFYPVDRKPPLKSHRAAYDTIWVFVRGIYVKHVVTEAQATGFEPITIMLEAAFWARVGSGSHVCEYRIVDEVGNYSHAWSPQQIINVRLNDGTEPLLPACYVKESDVNKVLDVDKLNGLDANIMVAIHSTAFMPGDKVSVRAAGRTAADVHLEKFYVGTVTEIDIDRVLSIPFTYADLKLWVGGAVHLSYERIRDGVANQPSLSINIQVIGTPVESRLLPPEVEGLVDEDTLPPDMQEVIVIANAYQGQIPSDRVQLILLGTYADGSNYSFDVTVMAGNGDIIFKLINGPDGDIAKLIGGTLRLYYSVTNANGNRFSEHLLLNVGDPAESLPAPEVKEATADNNLDPDHFSGDITVVVKAHPDILENDVIKQHFVGAASGGTAPVNELTVPAHWVGFDLPFTVKRQYVLANRNNTARVYYTLERDGQRKRLSRTLAITVGPALKLEVPNVLNSTVTGPLTARLDPRDVEAAPTFTVRVSYAPMYDRDDIKLHIQGQPGLGSPDIPARPGNQAQGYVDFDGPRSAVAANLELDSLIRFTMTRDGASRTSDTLTLSVLAFPAERLGSVSIDDKESDADINPRDVNTVRVALDSDFVEAGQALWIRLKGTTDHVLRAGRAITAAEKGNKRVEELVPESYLLTLDAGSELQVEVSVSLDGHGVEDSARRFVPVTYRISQKPRIIKELKLTGRVDGLVCSPDGERVYVANGNVITVISRQTNTVIHEISHPDLVAYRALAISPNGSRLYAAARSKLMAFSTASYQLIQTYAVPNTLMLFTFSPDGSRIYLTSENTAPDWQTTITTFNTNSSTPTATRTVTGYIYSVVINPSNNRMYFSRTPRDAAVAGGDICFYNLADFRPTTLWQADSNHSPFIFRPHRQTSPTLYINQRFRALLIINTITNTITKTLNRSGIYNIAFNPITEHACISGTGGLDIVDTVTEQIIERVDIPKTTYQIAITPDGKSCYVASFESTKSSLYIISL